MTAFVRFRNALAWHAHELAHGLSAAGHDVLLFCQAGSPLALWSSSAHFEVDATLNLITHTPVHVGRGLARLRRAIREFQPDVLNPHCPPGHSLLSVAGVLERSAGPLVRTVADPRFPKRNLLNRLLHERMTRGLIFTSASSRRRYENVFDLRSVSTQVIPPGFRSEDFVRDTDGGDYRKRLALTSDSMLVGVIARMSPEKGQEVLLQALALMTPAERSRLHVILAGEDSRERGSFELQHLARELRVADHVTFMGWMEDVRPLMRELDLGVIASTSSEAVCRAALEYMAFRVPIVASDVNILPEVVHPGENGWVYPHRDASALATCLRQAMADPTERSRRGEHGGQLVRSEFDLQREVDRTLVFFDDIRQGRAS